MSHCLLLFCNSTVMIEHMQLTIKVFLLKAKNSIGVFQVFLTVSSVIIQIINLTNVLNGNQNNPIIFLLYTININLPNTIIILIILDLIILFLIMIIQKINILTNHHPT